MSIAKGGILKVEFDDNAGFVSPTELTKILADGSNLEPSTDTEQLGNGKDAPSGKKLTGSFLSEDPGQAAFTELVAAEEAQTELYFRVYHLKGTGDYYTLKKCLVRCDYVPRPTGKLHARKVTLSGYAASEADLIGLTQS